MIYNAINDLNALMPNDLFSAVTRISTLETNASWTDISSQITITVTGSYVKSYKAYRCGNVILLSAYVSGYSSSTQNFVTFSNLPRPAIAKAYDETAKSTITDFVRYLPRENSEDAYKSFTVEWTRYSANSATISIGYNGTKAVSGGSGSITYICE